MRLVIKHSPADSSKPGQLSYRATYYLREPSTERFAPPELDQRFAAQKLSDLARRWYLLNIPTNVPDGNEALLSEHPSADTTLATFIPTKGQSVFEFESDDPIVIAALDERVRRAITMIFEDAVYSRYILETPATEHEFGAKELTPSGSALPPVPPAIRDKVIGKL